MAYVDELQTLLESAQQRLETCESDAAYAAILRQVRGLKADINALAGNDEPSDMDGILEGCDAVR